MIRDHNKRECCKKTCHKMLVLTLSLNIFVMMATANAGNVVFMDCMETPNIKKESTSAAAVSQRIEQKPETPEQIAIERQKLILGLLDGTLNIDRSIHSLTTKDVSSDHNVIISPISIAAAMSLILLGSRGETKMEVSKLLFGIDVNSVINTTQNNAEHYKYLGLLLNYFEDKSGETLGTQVNLAKAIFVQNNYNITPNFLKVAKESLNSEVISVDYRLNGLQAQQTINKWVSNQTRGKINNIQPDIPFPETKTIITSAVYFMGEWETPFFIEYTKMKPFYFGQNVDGKKSSKQSKDVVYVPMMIGSSDVLYHKNDEIGLRAIGLPYKGKKFVTYFVLPHLITLRDLIAKMNGNTLQNITKNTKLTETTYFVPKMTLESSTNLRPVLQNLGINKIFDPTKADFSNMASDPGSYISEILHKVQIIVDEIGTVASAATTVTMTRGGSLMFNVNRPFLFFIHHVESDTVVFWGTVHKPTPYSTTQPDPIKKKV